MKKAIFLPFLPAAACFGLLMLLLTLSGCGKASPQVRTGFAFDTVISITFYDEKDSGAVENAMAQLEHYEKIFSRTAPESELYAVNRKLAEGAADGASSVTVPVSEELYQALALSLAYAEKTGGAFDPTLGRLLEMYDFSGTEHVLPSEAVRAELLSHCGWKKLKLSQAPCPDAGEEAPPVSAEKEAGRPSAQEGGDPACSYRLTVADPDLVIDLGGMAKGYIADRLKEELLAGGVSSAIINLGGNILVIGTKPGGTPYRVGVTRPVRDSSEYLTSFTLSDASAVTSGSYQRFFEKDGVTYHHILDPSTGLPAESGLKSVTVVAKSSAEADILSTSLFVMGETESRRFLENFTDISVYFIDNNEKLTKY